MRIKKEFLDKWLAKLRSGEFIQYQGGLVDYNNPCGRCAAGVMLEYSDIVPIKDGCYTRYRVSNMNNVVSELPDIGVLWDEEKTTVSYINDWEDVSFNNIAAILEHNQLNGTFMSVPEEIRED